MMKRCVLALSDSRLSALLLIVAFVLPGCGDSSKPNEDDAAKPGGTDTSQASTDEVKMLPEPAAPDHPRVPEGLVVKDGFLVEKLFDTDFDTHGSWVAICKGPDDTLFVSAQYSEFEAKVGGKKVKKNRQALFQINPPAVDDYDGETQVIPQPVKINGAQGLCYAFGALYVMESGEKNGLVRVTDSDGDGLLDKKELLLNIWGDGEHSTHAIVPTPDGKGLFLVAGNMSDLPAKLDASRPVEGLWDEDHVLPQNPDGKGHASDVLAPGGWIVRVDPDGKDVTLHCAGFRNQYDIAVHPNGEVFAYDADMEYDLGQPWYRPTRINHAVSGAEFGWRNGSGKWPAYYEDSLPGVIDLGPGSPVGMTFGTGADFPTKYQRALFALDWTYGTIYAVHLRPDGASYTGDFESFITGKPLPVTDVAVADDGNMYFTAGGRRGDSALYRVSYYGVNDKSAPEIAPLTDLAKLRQEMETLHRSDAPADKLDFIWEHLGHADRHVRFAARVALEHQPPKSYAAKAKAEPDAMTRTLAGLALARHKHPAALEVLLGVEPSTKLEKLAWMRALAVDMYRKAKVNPRNRVRTYAASHLAKRDGLLAKVESFLPSDDNAVNTEVVRLRVALGDPTVIQFALDLMNSTANNTPPAWLALASQNGRYGKELLAMKDNPPPTFQLGLAFMLRNIKDGWTPTQRSAYFSWIKLGLQAGGGRSYGLSMTRMRNQAAATLTDSEKITYADLLKDPPVKLPPLVQPKGPGRKWTAKQATKLVEGKLTNRDYDRGVGLYQTALCSQCHRVGGLGGQIGPNLSTAASKFSIADFMRATIEPSHEVSDQYALTIVTLKDDKQIIGRLLEDNEAGVKIQLNVLSEKTRSIARSRIKKVETSPVSPMPAGLVNSMSATELRDLTAYVYSGGNKASEMFAEDEEE